jgi:hypothetical protein
MEGIIDITVELNVLEEKKIDTNDRIIARECISLKIIDLSHN